MTLLVFLFFSIQKYKLKDSKINFDMKLVQLIYKLRINSMEESDLPKRNKLDLVSTEYYVVIFPTKYICNGMTLKAL